MRASTALTGFGFSASGAGLSGLTGAFSGFAAGFFFLGAGFSTCFGSGFSTCLGTDFSFCYGVATFSGSFDYADFLFFGDIAFLGSKLNLLIRSSLSLVSLLYRGETFLGFSYITISGFFSYMTRPGFFVSSIFEGAATGAATSSGGDDFYSSDGGVSFGFRFLFLAYLLVLPETCLLSSSLGASTTGSLGSF